MYITYRIKFQKDAQSFLFRVGSNPHRNIDFLWEEFIEWLKTKVITSGPLEWIVTE